MRSALNHSRLFAQLQRPLYRPSLAAYTRPPLYPRVQPPIWITRARFTTSPTTIPPQNESASSSSEPPLSSKLATPSLPPRHQIDGSDAQPSEPVEAPSYQLTFTCKPCQKRSSHKLTKQGYHHGTVIITCPECKNRHIISDHLKVLSVLHCVYIACLISTRI